MITKINVQYDPVLKKILEYVKTRNLYTSSGGLLELMRRGMEMDILEFNKKRTPIYERQEPTRAELKAARRAERAERQERKAAEPKPKEQPKGDEWTHSEWMAELRRLYMAKADTLEGDEQKAFCEASLPRFKVEDDARKFLAELKAEAEADDW